MKDAQRPIQHTRSPVHANTVHQSATKQHGNMRRRSNLPLAAVSLFEVADAGTHFGHRLNAAGHSEEDVTVVSWGGSEAEQCQSAALH